VKLLKEHAHAALLAVLVLFFVAMPVAMQLDEFLLERFDRPLMEYALLGCFVLVLLAAVYAERGGISWRRPAVYVLAVLVLMRVGGTVYQGDLSHSGYRWFLISVEVFTAGFIFQICYSVLTSVTRRPSVGVETIAGVSAVYILLALGFASLHIAVFMYENSSVAYVGSIVQWTDAIKGGTTLRDWGPDFTYLSVVTQTTLGYGDIAPKSAIARGLVMTQTVVGQLYLAIVIARIVAMEIASRRLEDPN